MYKNYVWLPISLISARVNWGSILKSIHDFLKSNDIDGNQYIFKISFSYEEFEAINFTLLSHYPPQNELIFNIDKYFRNILANFPKHTSSINYQSLTCLFQPFNCNSIHYGLYPPIFLNVKSYENFNVEVELTKLIIIEFQDKEINDEELLTFAFYITYSFLNQILPSNTTTRDAFICEVISKAHKLDAETTLILSDLFTDSHSEIMEIAIDIEIKRSNKLPNWMKYWLSICPRFHEVEKDTFETYLSFVSRLRIQLGLNHQLFQFLSYSINTTLQIRGK